MYREPRIKIRIDMKYIDADLLKSKLKNVETEFKTGNYYLDNSEQAVGYENALIDFEQFIDSLQQEQPNNICAEIKEYYGEELAFEDERTKAAYHFFSAGKAFELKEYEEERKKHITDLLDNFQKGMNAGYEKAISELKNKEFLNESEQVFVDLVTERMLKEGPIPTLKGKQKAEFEKEFNRFKQITGMINWPGYIEVYKKVILWFMAWGADNLPNLNKVTDPDKLDFQQEQPSVPDNLKLNMTRTKLELNEIETLTHLVRAKAVEPGNFQGLYKGILSKLNKMFDKEYAEREKEE